MAESRSRKTQLEEKAREADSRDSFIILTNKIATVDREVGMLEESLRQSEKRTEENFRTVTSSLSHLANVVDDIRRSLSVRNKTDWASLGTWTAVLIGGVGMWTQPMKEDIAENRTSYKQLAQDIDNRLQSEMRILDDALQREMRMADEVLEQDIDGNIATLDTRLNAADDTLKSLKTTDSEAAEKINELREDLAKVSVLIGEGARYTLEQHNTGTVPRLEHIENRLESLLDRLSKVEAHSAYFQEHRREANHPHGVLGQLNELKGKLDARTATQDSK